MKKSKQLFDILNSTLPNRRGTKDINWILGDICHLNNRFFKLKKQRIFTYSRFRDFFYVLLLRLQNWQGTERWYISFRFTTLSDNFDPVITNSRCLNFTLFVKKTLSIKHSKALNLKNIQSIFGPWCFNQQCTFLFSNSCWMLTNQWKCIKALRHIKNLIVIG